VRQLGFRDEIVQFWGPHVKFCTAQDCDDDYLKNLFQLQRLYGIERDENIILNGE